MANPCVRPYLHFYPEDTRGAHLAEARQGARWLREVHNEALTPMLRVGNQDFYIHEPAMLTDGSICMPVRWFNRVEGEAREWYAWCWEMESVTVDEVQGWCVRHRTGFEVPAKSLLKAFPELEADAPLYGLPLPSRIVGKSLILTIRSALLRSRLVGFINASGTSVPWSFTDPTLGNPWRARSNGFRVLSLPLWLYCDDTSGNLSKKWNKHNSILFTLAGLPHEHAQKEFNIHFLSTSNLAPPLEMLDGVVEQLQSVYILLFGPSSHSYLGQPRRMEYGHGTAWLMSLFCLCHGYLLCLGIIPCKVSLLVIWVYEQSFSVGTAGSKGVMCLLASRTYRKICP